MPRYRYTYINFVHKGRSKFHCQYTYNYMILYKYYSCKHLFLFFMFATIIFIKKFYSQIFGLFYEVSNLKLVK